MLLLEDAAALVVLGALHLRLLGGAHVAVVAGARFLAVDAGWPRSSLAASWFVTEPFWMPFSMRFPG